VVDIFLRIAFSFVRASVTVLGRCSQAGSAVRESSGPEVEIGVTKKQARHGLCVTDDE
jgi:hypothetical protein